MKPFTTQADHSSIVPKLHMIKALLLTTTKYTTASTLGRWVLAKLHTTHTTSELPTTGLHPSMTSCIAHLVVPLQLLIHLRNLRLHVADFLILRLDLLLQLLDLVIQHKLELFQLLVFFLQVVDPLLLLSYRMIPLTQLLFQPRDVLLKRADGLVQLFLLLKQRLDVLLMLFDLFL